MNRLTTKREKYNGVDFYKIYNCDQNDAMLKLGKLEDLEEEIGIDFITLFKALKDGIYVWNDASKKETYKENVECLTNLNCDDEKYDREKVDTFRLVGVDYYELKDYGKTWALTKEELK